MPFSVTDAVDQYVASLEAPREPDGLWHPSSVFGCARQAVYQVRGVPASNPKDERSRRILRLGTTIHEFTQTALDRLIGNEVINVWKEVPLRHPRLKISGTADVLIEVSPGEYVLLELKSIGTQAAKYRDLPKQEHVMQWAAYAKVLREAGSPDLGIPPLGDALTIGRVVYLVKDDLEVREYPVVWSESLDIEIESLIDYLEQHRDGELPPRLPLEIYKGEPRRNWLCRGYCDWRSLCWDEQEDSIALAA